MNSGHYISLFFGLLFLFVLLLFNREFLLLFDITLIPEYRNSFRAIGVSLLLIASLIYVLRHPSSFQEAFISIRFFDVAWLSFIGIILLSTLWAYNTALAIHAFRYFTLLFILYHILYWFVRHFPQFTEQYVLKIIVLLSIFYSLHTLYAIYDLSSKLEGSLNNITIYKIRDLIGHKSLLATVLFFMLAHNYWGFNSFKQSAWKYLALGLIVVLAVLIVVLQARGMLVGLGIFFLLMFIYGIFLDTSKKRFSSKIILGMGLISIIGLGTISYFLVDSSTLISRLDPSTYAESRGANERFALWGYSWGLIKENPITGVGANNWKVAYQQFGLEAIDRLKYGKALGNPHNDILKIWSEIGIIGFLGYISIYLLPIIGGILFFFKEKEDQQRRFTIWLLCSILIAYQISAFFTGHLYRLDMQLFVLVTMTFLMFHTTSTTSLLHRTVFSLPSNKFLLLMPMLLLGITTLYNINRLKQEAPRKNIRHVLKNKNWKVLRSKAVASHSSLKNLWGIHTPIKYYEGLANYHLGEHETAIQNFKQGLEIAHPFHYQSMSKIGQIYLEQGKYKNAKYWFKQALDITPVYSESLFGLAQLYQEEGKFNKSRYWLNKVNFPKDTLQRNDLLGKLDSLQN